MAQRPSCPTGPLHETRQILLSIHWDMEIHPSKCMWCSASETWGTTGMSINTIKQIRSLMNALCSLSSQILYIPKSYWKMWGKCTINAVSCFLGHAVSISMAIWKVHECKALLNTLKINTEETIETHSFLFYSMLVLLSFAWPDVTEFQICSTIAVNKMSFFHQN